MEPVLLKIRYIIFLAILKVKRKIPISIIIVAIAAPKYEKEFIKINNSGNPVSAARTWIFA